MPAVAVLNTNSTKIKQQIESKKVEQDSTQKNTDNSELERQPENKLDAHLTLTEEATVVQIEDLLIYYLAAGFVALTAIGTSLYIKSK